ncbi:hypothetical protein ACKVWL_011551, partial [Pyricularia oryzae]
TRQTRSSRSGRTTAPPNPQRMRLQDTPPSDGPARLDMTQLIQKLQRDVDVQKEVY